MADEDIASRQKSPLSRSTRLLEGLRECLNPTIDLDDAEDAASVVSIYSEGERHSGGRKINDPSTPVLGSIADISTFNEETKEQEDSRDSPVPGTAVDIVEDIKSKEDAIAVNGSEEIKNCHLEVMGTMAVLPSIDLMEKWRSLPFFDPSSYLDPADEVNPRQASNNLEIRNILKSKKRGPPLAASPESAPDFINLSTFHSARQSSNESTAASSASSYYPKDTASKRDKRARSSARKSSPRNAIILESPDSVARNNHHNAIDSSDPPWLPFVGFSAAVPSITWRAVLRTLRERADFFARLHAEIVAFAQWLDPTPEELLLRHRVLARITAVVRELWPGGKLQPFGSFYTGLCLPNGDLDLCLEVDNYVDVPKDVAMRHLKVLSLCLSRLGIPLAVEIIESAKVPIIKFIDSETGIPVDISFKTESALSTSRYVVKMMGEWPALRPLLLVLKVYLQQRGLNETYRGGVGSYLLFVMCLSFLQQRKSLDYERTNLGHLLLDFLQLYGRDFNYDTTGISVRGNGCYYRKTVCDRFNVDRPGLFSVESPLAPELDLGRNSYDIRTVRTCFRQSFITLVELMHNERVDNGSNNPNGASPNRGDRYSESVWEMASDSVNRSNMPDSHGYASILQHLIFPDPLLRHRIKFPVVYDGKSDFEQTEWWQEVRGLFNLPVGACRPPPRLPACVLEQVADELEKESGCLAQIRQGTTSNSPGKSWESASKKRKVDRYAREVF